LFKDHYLETPVEILSHGVSLLPIGLSLAWPLSSMQQLGQFFLY